ncbi:MAG: hypothetical protein BWK79_13285 [Beggiatoa sp. IS2]|nr:MAG: hypothetical protein BWK79_13285 [Beggiatoa sp. IS2]
MSQPALKTEEISNELDILLEKCRRFEKVDGFTLKRLKNEAKKLLSKEPSSAYWILGAIGMFEDDIDGVHENYKKALDLSKTPLIYSNYSVSLGNMGYHSQAFDLLKKIEIKDDKRLLFLLDSGVMSGHFHETKLLLSNQFNQKYNQRFNIDHEQVISFMDHKGVSDADLRKLIEVTFNVAQQRGIFTFKPPEICLSPDEETFCFEYWIEVPVDVATVVELNTQLDSSIIEQCPPSITKQSGFVPLFITARDE